MTKMLVFSLAGLVAAATIATGTAATAADKVNVRLNWIPGSEHGYFFLGKEKGWYAAEGLDIEILPGQGSTLAVKTVGNGEDDFALADGATIAHAWETGVPLVATAVLLKESPAAIYSRKSDGINTLAGLCGKRVGINIKSTTTAQYQAMVRSANLKDCKIEEVPTAAGGSKELLAGLVDAAVTFSYEDPIMIQVKGIALNEIIASDFFKLYSMAIITNQHDATTRRDMVDRFMRATMKSMKYAIAHPDESLAATLKVMPEANVDYEREKLAVYNGLLVVDDKSGNSLGKQDLAGWQASIDTLAKLSIIKTKIDLTGKFLPLAD